MFTRLMGDEEIRKLQKKVGTVSIWLNFDHCNSDRADTEV